MPDPGRPQGGTLAAVLLRLFTLVSCLSLAPLLLPAAESPLHAFDKANRLYERGQFLEAAAAYREILKSGKTSAPLYFNLGNAYFKSGQVGQAILCYRLAQRLDPGDPDIQGNLRFAREVVQGSAPRPTPWWQRFLHLFTLNQWTVLASSLFWLWLTLVSLRFLLAEPPAGLRRVRAAVLLAFLLCGTAALLTWQRHYLTVHAVVTQREAVLHHGPLDESPSLQTLHDGHELEVVDQKDDWLRVSGASRGIGWIRRSAVALIQ